MGEETVSNEIKEYILKLNQTTPYHRLLDMNITKIRNGYCEAKLVVEEKHANPMRVAHGGVAFSILDTVSGSAARTIGYEVSTVEMNISYFKPSYIGNELIAVGEVLKAGKKIIVAEGKLYHEGKLLSVSRQNLMNLGPLNLK